jgi:outer membrane lipoprotein-sorting protein
MKRVAMTILAAVAAMTISTSVWAATTSAAILTRVKAAEAQLADFKADTFITEGHKKTVSGMGEGYADILKLEKATICYRKPDKIRYDGYAQGIKAAYIQNGYDKLILAPMIKHRESVKNSPGKRQDTLDLGFLGSRLWVDNTVTVVGADKAGVLKLKLVPKSGDKDKRHDMLWVDPGTLKILKREKYRGSGELRVKMTYSDFETLAGKLPIATVCKMSDPNGGDLGTVVYKNIKVNVGLLDSLFSMSSR